MAFTESQSAPVVRTHSLRAALMCAALGVTAALLPRDDRLPYYAVVLGFLACLLLPVWVAIQRGRFDLFETVNVVGLQYLLFYGMGAVWSVGDPEHVSYDIHLLPFMLRAAIYSLLGYLALLIGYHTPTLTRPRRRVALWPKSAWFLLIPAGLGSVGSFARAIVTRVTQRELRIVELASSLAQLAPLFIMAWGAAWIIVLSGRATDSQRRLLWVLTPVAMVVAYANYQIKAIIITIAAVPIVALWYARHRLPWKTLTVLGLVVVFVIFPFINYFRALDPFLPQDKRFEMTYRMLTSQTASEYTQNALIGFEGRMALVNSVALVLRDVPRWEPYARGETILGPAVAFLIPRVFWPDKPYFATGYEFGRLFRVVGPQDELTSIAPTVVGELYWNFDLPGILIGMLLLGFGLRWLYRQYGQMGAADPLRCAAHMAILVQVTHFDGGIAGHGSGLLRNVLLFEALIWLGKHLNQFDGQEVDA